MSCWEASQCFVDVLQNIFHGSMSLDQLYLARPVPLMANYRCPLAGLYLCGSGAHPGMVTHVFVHLFNVLWLELVHPVRTGDRFMEFAATFYAQLFLLV